MNGQRHLWALDARLYFLAITLSLTLIFASLNPEGSGQVAGWLLIPFWLLHTALPIALLVGAHIWLSWFSAFESLNPWIKIALSGLVGAILFSPFALFLDLIFGNGPAGVFADPRILTAEWLNEILGAGPPIILVWLAINAPHILQLNFGDRDSSTLTETAENKPSSNQPAPIGFWKVMPKSLGQELIYLQAELHYIRVVTTRGETLILYNLRDAIEELPPGLGTQTHRSYWVAFNHLEDLKRRGAHWVCVLKSGQTIPVSRRRAASVKKIVESRSPEPALPV